MTYLAITIMLVFMLAMSTSAVIAFCWAAKTGQFSRLREGSRVIFNDDEPEGVVTDSFPSRPRSSQS
jgi:cbb3-type cytochrome oxidase maturation protein